MDLFWRQVQTSQQQIPLPRIEKMMRELDISGESNDLVHFDGHGTFLPEAHIGALCFEKLDDGAGK